MLGAEKKVILGAKKAVAPEAERATAQGVERAVTPGDGTATVLGARITTMLIVGIATMSGTGTATVVGAGPVSAKKIFMPIIICHNHQRQYMRAKNGLKTYIYRQTTIESQVLRVSKQESKSKNITHKY